MHRLSVTLLTCGLAAVVGTAAESLTHVVKEGDTLSGIARHYYGDWRMWERIAQANALQRPDRLRKGQQLIIPVGELPAAAPASDPDGAGVSEFVVLAPKQASWPAATKDPPASTEPSRRRHNGGVAVKPVPAVAPAPVAAPVPTLPPPAVALDSDTLRRLAGEAVVRHYANVNLAAYDPGYLVRLEAPTPAAETRVVVAWLGRETLALEKGATSELDRKQVLKIEVWLTGDGRVLKVSDRPVWLNRRSSVPATP